MHKDTGEKYIGQTTGSLADRWKYHCKPSSKCIRIRNAIQKYGTDSFDVIVLDICKSYEELNKKETFWIQSLNTLSPNGYNLQHGGNNHKVFSEETRKKMSESAKIRLAPSSESLKKRSASMLGQKRSADTCRKQSERQIGVPKSTEHKAKISKTLTGRKLSPERITKMVLCRLGTKMSPDSIQKTINTKLRLRAERDIISPPTKKQLADRKRHLRNKIALEALLCSLV